jgi:hypothetical protein
MRNSNESVIKQMIKMNNHKLNIAFPAVVVNTDRLTDGFIDVKPIVNYMNSLTGDTIRHPILRDVSIVFPSSKNSTICFPVVQGDTVELIFQSVDIEDFVGGNTQQHDPFTTGYGNLANVVAYVGFAPYQKSCFNPSNYNMDFNSQDLNIVHNKNTDNEIIFKLTSDGDLKVLNAKKVSYDCEEFEVTASEKIKLTSPLISENGR